MSKEVVKSFKYRAYANKKGHAELDQILIDHCELYNAVLENRRTAYEYHKVSIKKKDQYNEWTLVRQDDPRWDNESLRLARGTIDRVDTAFTGFHKRVKKGEKPGYPRYRSRSRFETLAVNNVQSGMVKLNGDGTKYIVKIKGLPRLEIPIKGREAPDPKSIRSLTITKKDRKINVVFNARIEMEPLEPVNREVGLDMGVKKRITTSDGDFIERVDTSETNKKRLQRKVSRAKPGSKSRKRKVKNYRRECNKVADRKKQATHRLTTDMIRTYDFIALEKLILKNMTKKGGAGKAGLNREILANAWGMIRSQLQYKAEWAGRVIVLVDPKYTSQICSNCGIKDKTNRDGEHFHCKSCGLDIDADLNAAINILRRALKQFKSSGRAGIEPVSAVECSTKPSGAL